MEADEALSAPMGRVLEEWTDFDVASFALGRYLGIFPEAGGLAEFQKVKGVFWSNDDLGETLTDILGVMVERQLLEFREHSVDHYPSYRWPGGMCPAKWPMSKPELVYPLTELWAAPRVTEMLRDGTGPRTSGGVRLTDEVFAKLAEEAEAGYDLDRVRPRGSRPMSGRELGGC